MGNRFKLAFILFTGVLLPWASSSAQPPSSLKAVTSLFPLQEFARAVGADKVQVALLLPPGAEPHTWSLGPVMWLK
jgi:zinc transport system substrate-binding protein